MSPQHHRDSHGGRRVVAVKTKYISVRGTSPCLSGSSSLTLLNAWIPFLEAKETHARLAMYTSTNLPRRRYSESVTINATRRLPAMRPGRKGSARNYLMRELVTEQRKRCDITNVAPGLKEGGYLRTMSCSLIPSMVSALPSWGRRTWSPREQELEFVRRDSSTVTKLSWSVSRSQMDWSRGPERPGDWSVPKV